MKDAEILTFHANLFQYLNAVLYKTRIMMMWFEQRFTIWLYFIKRVMGILIESWKSTCYFVTKIKFSKIYRIFQKNWYWSFDMNLIWSFWLKKYKIYYSIWCHVSENTKSNWTHFSSIEYMIIFLSWKFISKIDWIPKENQIWKMKFRSSCHLKSKRNRATISLHKKYQLQQIRLDHKFNHEIKSFQKWLFIFSNVMILLIVHLSTNYTILKGKKKRCIMFDHEFTCSESLSTLLLLKKSEFY